LYNTCTKHTEALEIQPACNQNRNVISFCAASYYHTAEPTANIKHHHNNEQQSHTVSPKPSSHERTSHSFYW